MKWRGLSDAEPQGLKSTLREELAERKRLMQLYVPPATQQINLRTGEELRASGILDRIKKVGDPAPAFSLPDHNGNAVSSRALLERGPLIIAFLRGRWCPFCCAEAEALSAAAPAIRQAGASLVAISPQNVHQSSLMHDQHRLAFPLLSDARNNIARQFGIVYRLPEYQKELFAGVFINLPHINGDASWELPLPATFVIDKDERIVYAWASADYTERSEPAEVLQVVRSG